MSISDMMNFHQIQGRSYLNYCLLELLPTVLVHYSRTEPPSHPLPSKLFTSVADFQMCSNPCLQNRPTKWTHPSTVT